MKSAILIITYTSSKQIERLVQKLNNNYFDFYIHVDKKLNLETHKKLFDIPNVYFVKDRVDVKWGTYDTVKATFNALRQLEATGIKYDSVTLISGQDYPIKSAEYISSFLRNNIGRQFIHYKNFDDWKGAQHRVEKYFLGGMKIVFKFRIQKFLNFLNIKRNIPKNIKLYGYSTFWTLSLDCALYIVKYMENNPSLERYFKYTFGSDELIYQTVIMNCKYKNEVVNNN